MTFSPEMQHSASPFVSQAAIATRHHDSMLASLNHRLSVARARQDTRLIALLEQELQQILTRKPRSPWWESLRRWGSSVMRAIAMRDQIHVTELRDNTGQVWWRAYDPQTGKEVYTDSETELLLWIEEHYEGR